MTLAALVGCASVPKDGDAETRAYRAIDREIQEGLRAVTVKDIDAYMASVPKDYRIVEDDGSITDRDKLREKQLQAWSIIIRTNANEQRITGFQLGCAGRCATVWTDQRWDRQMRGRDGKSEHRVVTTQKHKERWELRGRRWVNIAIEELGGTTTVDGKPY
jgi:hypothetical protein